MRSLPVPFIPFMLCDRSTDVRRFQDRGFMAEPKLAGRRTQLLVAGAPAGPGA